jgi:hypothetical protein
LNARRASDVDGEKVGWRSGVARRLFSYPEQAQPRWTIEMFPNYRDLERLVAAQIPAL